MRNQPSLFGEARRTLPEAIQGTIHAFAEINAADYDHWEIGYSGGKDSTAVVTLVAHLIETGQIERPGRISVLYADTGMEIPPLQQAALTTLKCLEEHYGFETYVVRPELDERFFVSMFGRGIPLPNNGRMRWCTRQIKADPMEAQLQQIRNTGESVLLLTGIREGESAIRDQSISIACSKDGGECGQGYLHVKTASAIHADSFAPILPWRVCHVWDWLWLEAPSCFLSGTGQIAEVYGQENSDGEEPLSARTGCINCPLVTNPHDGKPRFDQMVRRVISIPKYRYLAPLDRLLEVYAHLAKESSRLRKDGTQRLKDGSLPKNLQRKGPLTMEARRWGLAQVKAIQEEINAAAHAQDMPPISLISEEEEARILGLIAANTWPDKWSGEEPRADENIPIATRDGHFYVRPPLIELGVAQ